VRTHYCAKLNENNIGQKVKLVGWVNSYRDHGGVIFIDLRDKTGLIQLVADPAESSASHKIADKVRDEYVVSITGLIRDRGEALHNPRLKTGKIEVVIEEIVIENESKTLPFAVGDRAVNEELRLKHRFGFKRP
jgi:aspartyl-tRNA synthetase